MLDELKANNRAWAEAQDRRRPRLLQAPGAASRRREYLWIGCSDSRVPANEIVGLDPGRAVRPPQRRQPRPAAGRQLPLGAAVRGRRAEGASTSWWSATTAAAASRAAVDGQRRGLVDHWLHPIREVAHDHRAELDAIADERARLDRLCELNVMRQVRNVASDVFVQDAWARGQAAQRPRLGLFAGHRPGERPGRHRQHPRGTRPAGLSARRANRRVGARRRQARAPAIRSCLGPVLRRDERVVEEGGDLASGLSRASSRRKHWRRRNLLMIRKPISANSHITEPPNCYVDFIDPAFRDRAPVHQAAGGRRRRLRDRRHAGAGAAGAAGRRRQGARRRSPPTASPSTTSGAPAGTPKYRVADQDTDGVAAEMIYPTVGMLLCNHPDFDFKKACFEAYNRWLADYCAVAPDRLCSASRRSRCARPRTASPSSRPSTPWASRA